MFERFTDRARAAVRGAQEAARELKHGRIGTEHLLLGMLSQPESIAAKVLDGAGITREGVLSDVQSAVAGRLDTGDALASIGIDLDEVTRKVEEAFGPGALQRTRAGGGRFGGHIPFSPRAKKVLELSLREALVLKHNYIGTEHMLLGLLREGEGLACQVIGDRLDHAGARATIVAMLQRRAG